MISDSDTSPLPITPVVVMEDAIMSDPFGMCSCPCKGGTIVSQVLGHYAVGSEDRSDILGTGILYCERGDGDNTVGDNVEWNGGISGRGSQTGVGLPKRLRNTTI